MKKIVFILLMLISGTAIAQTDVPASATIVSAISLTADSGLYFGSFSEGEAGTITIGLDDAISTTGSITVIPSSTKAAAKLTVNAAATYAYGVTYGLNPNISNGTDTMPISAINDNSSGMGTGNDETFSLGATLTADGSETTGLYTGSIVVTVAYN